MSVRTSKQINADKKFFKDLEQHIEKKKRRVLVLSLHDDIVRISGEEKSLEILDSKRDLTHTTLSEIITYMRAYGENSEETFKYVTRLDLEDEEPFPLPKMRYCFQEGKWSLDNARDQVTDYMTHLGYGSRGPKVYREEKDEPSWWPDSLSWSLFTHPSKATKEVLNKIMRGIMEEYNIPDNYHIQELDENGAIVTSKKKRKRKSKSKKSRAKKDKQNPNVDTSHEVDTSQDDSSHDSNSDNNSTTTNNNNPNNDSYENLLQSTKRKKKRSKKSKKSQPDDTHENLDDDIAPPVATEVDEEIHEAVNVAELSDGLDELERMAAACESDETRESSEGD